MTVDEILARLEGVRRNGRGWTARCPAHEDRKPSLGIAEGEDGRVLLTCRAGCSTENVVAKIGLGLSDLFDDGVAEEEWTPHGPAVAVYDYTDADGKLLYQVCRTRDKQFPCRQPDASSKSGWRWNMKGLKPVLFRLPYVGYAIDAGMPVYVCEGEKDVLAIEKAGGTATCNLGGAGKWQKRFNEPLRGAKVVLVQDKDDAGRRHMADVYASLQGVADSVRLVEPATGKDAYDHLAAGLGLDELLDVPAANGYRRLVLRRLSDVPSRAITFLVPGMIPLRTFTLVAGVGGIAKSMWLTAVAAGVTTGAYGEPADVLVISYEDTAEEIWRPRLLAANGDPARVSYVDVQLDEGGVVELPEDFYDLELAVREVGARLVVVDPVVAAIDTALDAHKDQHVRAVLGRLVGLAESTGCAIAGLGHLNKTPSKDFYIRVSNSVAFWNAARSVVLVTEDEDEDDRLISQVKANWSRRRPIERWRIEPVLLPKEIDAETGKPIETARLVFVEEASDVDPTTLLDGRKTDGSTKRDLAIALLEDALSDGDWHEKPGLAKLAAAQGISLPTFERAARKLDIESDRRGFPATAWWRLHSFVNPSSLVDDVTGQNPHERAVSSVPSCDGVEADKTGTDATGDESRHPGDDGYELHLLNLVDAGHITQAEALRELSLHRVLEAVS